MINQARSANGLPPLELVFADMILTTDPSVPDGDEENTSFSNKMSSTIIRQYLSSAENQATQQP